MRQLNLVLIAVVMLFIAACAENSNPTSNSPDMGTILNNAYNEAIGNSMLHDFRTNAGLNPAITLEDSLGTYDEGATTIKFNGQPIFHNTWGHPETVGSRMRTVVKHGFSPSEKYFLYVFNISTDNNGVISYEYRIFTTVGSDLQEIHSLFRDYIFGIEPYNGKYLIKSTNSGPGPGTSGPSFMSLMDESGSVVHYEIN